MSYLVVENFSSGIPLLSEVPSLPYLENSSHTPIVSSLEQGKEGVINSPSITGNLESHSYLLGFNVLLQVFLRRKARRMLSIYSMRNSKMFSDLQQVSLEILSNLFGCPLKQKNACGQQVSF